MCKIYPYIFLLFHYSYFYYVACLQNEILKYSCHPRYDQSWRELKLFHWIYNIHFKEPLA